MHEVAKGLRIGVRSGDIRPVYCGTATEQIGIERILDLITEYFPSYAEKGRIQALNAKGDKIDMETNENEAMSAFVFKTTIDPFVGKISYLKVMSGVLNSDSQVYNSSKDANEKIAQVYVINGKFQNGVGKLFTGDIGAVVKLQNTQTNDTLCTSSKVVHYEPINFPKPMLGYAIWPKTKADEDKMSVGIKNMCEEDRTIRLDKNAETHEQVLYSLGDQHTDLIISKLKSKYKVEVTTTVPTVQYRETIRGKAEAQGKYKKQNGGAGQYGDVWVRFEPTDSEDMVFAEEVFGGAVPKQYFPPTEQGLRDCMNKGVLAGFKVVGVKATLFDGSYHPVDSKEVAFKEAARLAYNAAMPKANPVLLEPIGKVTITAPEEYTGTLMGDITKRRGLILDMGMNEDNEQVITAEAPMSEILTYANDLRSMTQGRGKYVVEFDRYQAAPKEVADKVIAAAKAKAEA
jgi:elongation factor G